MKNKSYSKKEVLAWIEGAKWSLNMISSEIGNGGAGRLFNLHSLFLNEKIETLEKEILNNFKK